jgi:pyruvate dehydrogenase E2 component (dihydrolipoamide acetyltransferase)
MAYIIRMPQMGMEMDEGEVVEWTRDEGDPVEEDDVIAVVESEKATNEVEAREGGTVRRVVVPEGGTVEPGTPIGIFAQPDEDISDLEAEIESAGAGDDETAGDDGESEAAATGAGDAGPAPSSGGGTSGESGADAGSGASAEEVRATPGAKQLASDRGIDLTAVEGTGPQGVITEDDVADHAEPAGAGGPATRTIGEARDLSGIQQTISDRLSESYRNAVHVTVKRSFDAGTLRSVGATAAGLDASLTDLLIKGVGAQLAAQPEFNALFEDGQHKLVEEVNVAVAVDVDAGLLTPVVPSVTDKSVEAVAATRADLTERAMTGEFTSDDLAGGTFTVSNLGPFGIDSFDPVINPPQVAILGVGRVRDDGTMTLSLSFDHRVVNGADAARFLDGVVENLTDLATLASYFETDLL